MIFSTKKEKKYTFVEAGEGHPLVLLHGLMGGLSNFDKMVDFFSDRGFKVYVPQLPIYDLPVLNTNLTTLAKYIIKFISVLQSCYRSRASHVYPLLTSDQIIYLKFALLFSWLSFPS